MKEAMRAHLTGKILPFWQGLKGGYYGYVDFDLNVRKNAPKGCILNSRILWTFSTAARILKDESYLPFARQALASLKNFEDPVNGGVFWSVTAEGKPLDTTKHTYCQAFTVYGLAAYARATGDKDVLQKAMKLFDLIETRCRDEGGYAEACKADFSPESNEKLSENGVMAGRTMNTLLHVLEAYAELYRASGDERVRRAGADALDTALNVLYNPAKHRLEVFFDRDFHSLLDMQSYGHDIEASWLMWDAARALLPGEQLAPYKAMCLDLARAVLDRAMTDHGLRNECVDGVDNEKRIWWVQAEAVLGFSNAYQLSGEKAFLDAAEKMWRAVQDMIVDKRPGGEWFWATDEYGIPSDQPIVEEWKCPYHNSRMCLRMIETA